MANAHRQAHGGHSLSDLKGPEGRRLETLQTCRNRPSIVIFARASFVALALLCCACEEVPYSALQMEGAASAGDAATIARLIAAGADGVISVVGNAFPKEFGAMVHHALKNEFNEARSLHYRLLQITQNLFVEGNPAGIKEVLAHLDLCDNYLRLPLVPVSQATSEKLRRLLIDEDFIK